MLYINGRFLTQKITGTQRFAIEVVKALDGMVNRNEIEILSPPGIINAVELKNIAIRCIGNNSGHYWTQVIFPRYVLQNRGVSLTMVGMCPLLCPDYFVAHDITFIKHPESFSRSFRFAYEIDHALTLKRCKKIFTVSEFSKREICEYFNIFPEMVVVVSNSSTHLLESEFQETDIQKFGIQDDQYYLSVSSRNLHKNQRYIALLAEKYPYKKFVIVGGGNFSSFTDVKFSKLDNLIFTGYVEDKELFSLYKHAKGFIFPSLYEGFGIPPLEAITMGVKRVALSDIPVFRELFKEDVYFFNPYNINSFNMIKFEKTKISKTSKINYLHAFSWRKTAKIMLEVIRNTENSKKGR